MLVGKKHFVLLLTFLYRFHVNEETGEIFVSVDADQDHKLLDRETIDTYYVTFEASDGGGLRTTVPAGNLSSGCE